MGLTDTDDSLAEIKAKRPVRIVYLDSDSKGLGIIVIPNSAAVIHGAPNIENAKKLLDFILSPQVEAKLALGESGQIPLNTRRLPIRGSEYRMGRSEWLSTGQKFPKPGNRR